MLHNEFNTLADCKVSQSQYEKIERVYMEMGCRDKTDIIRIYKGFGMEGIEKLIKVLDADFDVNFHIFLMYEILLGSQEWLDKFFITEKRKEAKPHYDWSTRSR